jgi:hypothetical protein
MDLHHDAIMARSRVLVRLTHSRSAAGNILEMFPRCCCSFSTDTNASTTNSAWSEHRLNSELALVKAAEVSHFKDLCKQPATVLQGIGPKHAAHL